MPTPRTDAPPEQLVDDDAGRTRRTRVTRHGLRLVLILLVLAGVVAVPLVLTTSRPPSEPAESVVYDKLGVQDVRLSIPATTDPKGIAVWFHGQSGGVDNRMDEPFLQALLHQGWVVASSDFHTASWGNGDSTMDTKQLIAWAQEQTGVPVRMFVSGSMGATVSLNAMTHGVPAPPCWYGVKPAVDVTKMRAVPGAVKIISEAYGGRPVPPDRNPVNRIDELSTETRYRLVASPQDTWVRIGENAERLRAGLLARGADVTQLRVTGTHDDPSHFNPADLVAFAAGCA